MTDKALTHAQRASEMLARLADVEDKITERHKDDMLRMQDGVSGLTAQINKNNAWTIEVVKAEALTAIALLLCEIKRGPKE